MLHRSQTSMEKCVIEKKCVLLERKLGYKKTNMLIDIRPNQPLDTRRTQENQKISRYLNSK